MSIVFFAVAIAVLVGGVGGSLAAQAGMLPAGLQAHWAFVQSVGSFGAAGLALIGVAIVMKKTKKFDRLVGGTSTASRIRRNRLASKAQGEAEDEGEAEDADEIAPASPAARPVPAGAPQPPRGVTPIPGRTTPRPGAQVSVDTGTRQVRRSTGSISNRGNPAQ